MNMHEQTNELLPALALGELSASQAAVVQAHLNECPACHVEFARLQSLLTYTSQQQIVTVETSVVEAASRRLFANMHSEQAKQSVATIVRNKPPLLSRLARSRIMNSTSFRLSAATIATVAVLISLHFAFGPASGARPAYAIEQTIRKLKDARLVHMSGKVNLPNMGVIDAQAEIWATPDARGAQSEDLKVILGQAPLRYQLIVHNNKSYEFLPLAKQVNISPGKKITLNPWPGSRFFEEFGARDTRNLTTTFGKDPETQRESVFLSCAVPRLRMSFWAQCDLETKMPVHMKGWWNTEFSGQPAYDMDHIAYDEPVSADFFTSQIPEGAKVVRDAQMDWDAHQGMDMGGMTFELASQRIATLYMQAIMRGDWATAHNLWPLRPEKAIAEDFTGDLPAKILAVDAPYEGVGYNAGLIVPCHVRFPQGQVVLYKFVVHMREIDHKQSCAIIAYYEWPVLEWNVDQGLAVAGQPRQDVAKRLVRRYLEAVMQADWSGAHGFYPARPEQMIISDFVDNPPMEILDIGEPREKSGCPAFLYVRYKTRCNDGQIAQGDLVVQFSLVDGQESCAIVNETDAD